MNIPTFIVVGAQKSGTDSLFSYLIQHPEVNMAHPKEPHFFSKDPKFTKLTLYERCFYHNKPACAIGEASTSYMAVGTSAKRIYEKLGDDIKLIFILRNPTDRTYSSYFHMRQSRPFYDTRSLNEAIAWQYSDVMTAVAEEKRRILMATKCNTIDVISFAEFGSEAGWNYRYVTNSWYRPQIENFMRYFSRKNLHFIILDDLQLETKNVVLRLYEFIGVDPIFVDRLNSDIRNVTRLPKADLVGRLFSYRVIRNWGRQLAELGVGTILRKRVRQLVTKEYPPMPQDVQNRLAEMFAPENTKLSDLIGVDLSCWNSI